MAHQNRKNPHQDGTAVSGMAPLVNTSVNGTYWLQLRISTVLASGQSHRHLPCLESQENHPFMKMCRRNRSVKQVSLQQWYTYTRGPSTVTHREPPGVCVCNTSPRDWGAFPQLRNVLSSQDAHAALRPHQRDIYHTLLLTPGTPWRTPPV